MEQGPFAGSNESGEEDEALKAESMMAAAMILREVGFPDNPEDIMSMEPADILVIKNALESRCDELDGGSNNEELTLGYLAPYQRLLETMSVSDVEAERIITSMERVLPKTDESSN